MENLSEDIIFLIAKYLLSSKDLESMMGISKIFKSSIPSIYYKSKKFHEYVKEQKTNYKKKNCINNNCIFKISNENRKAVGETNIYYLQENIKVSLLMEYIMEYDTNFCKPGTYNIFIPYAQNKKEERKKDKKLKYKNEKCVRRVIPYCYNCTNLYVNYGNTVNNNDSLLLKY